MATGRKSVRNPAILHQLWRVKTRHRSGSTPRSPGLGSPEFGNWSHVPGTGIDLLRDVSYGYDENGNFTGRAEVTASITLTSDTFTADKTIDVFDADENLLFSFCGMWPGTRFQ